MTASRSSRQHTPARIAVPSSSFSGSSPYQDTAEDEYYYDGGPLNLGAETPLISPAVSRESSWLKTGDPFALAMHATSKQGSLKRSSTSSMFPSAKPVTSIYGAKPPAPVAVRPQRDVVWDATCGICFETAVSPHRTECCGNIFCDEHLSDWMERDNHCPTCRVLMSDRVYTPKSPHFSPEAIVSPAPGSSSSSSAAQTDEKLQPWSDSPHLIYPSLPSLDSESLAVLSRVGSILFLALVYYVLLA